MLSVLKQHPFKIKAFFESSLVLTYAVPIPELEKLIPNCLTLDTFEDKWAFIAVAIVKTKNLRPSGFYEKLGNDFILTGYRIFVKYVTNQGKRLRGLYILKSETDKKKMEILGSIFTQYNYTTTDIKFVTHGSRIEVQSNKSGLKITADEIGMPDLPQYSPFNSWKEARRFSGPLPFTFSFNPATKAVLIIEGVREKWVPKPVKIIEETSQYIDRLGLKGIVLANAFIIKGVPYSWEKGKTEIWNG